MVQLVIGQSAVLLGFPTLLNLLRRRRLLSEPWPAVATGLAGAAAALAGWELIGRPTGVALFQAAFVLAAVSGDRGGWVGAAAAFAAAAIGRIGLVAGPAGPDLAVFAACSLFGCVLGPRLRTLDGPPWGRRALGFALGVSALAAGGRLLPVPVLAAPASAVTMETGLELVLLGFSAFLTQTLLLDQDRAALREEELQATEQRFRLAFTTSPDAININRLSDGLYLDVNDGFTAISGYRREELIGRSSLKLDIWADPVDRDALVRGLREKGLVRNLEARFRVKDGSLRTGLMSAAVIRLKGEPHILSITRDITERKQLEEALNESERRYRSLFEDHAAVNLLIHPETGAILDANHAAAAFYGWSRNELKKMKIGEINTLPPDRVKAAMARADLHQQTQFEFRHRCADGSIKDVKVFSSGIELAGDRCLHSIVVDVTREKQLEAQLRQAQKMEAVGQLAGGVAHDFNNLLQVINGYADLLLTKLGTDHPVSASLGKILETGRRAAHLVTQLLTFSRRQVLQPVDLDLNEVIESGLKMIRRLIGEQIEVRFLPGYHLGTIHADRTMLEQILMNLCLNARDAMPDGGQLVIETENVRVDERYTENHWDARPGRYVLMSITDSGHGMDKETLSKIFDPFFTTKAPGKGTGLGMAMVYGIVKQHDAMINAYSEPGRGTAFKIYFPLLERAAAEVGSKLPEGTPGGTETVLVAEDDAEVRDLVVNVLEHAGYRVIAADNGLHALELLRADPAPTPDLFLLDVVMPQLSGWQVFERLRELRPGSRVLFMSGYSENAVHTGFVLKSGCHLIEKPFSRDDLLRKVRTVLDQPLLTPSS